MLTLFVRLRTKEADHARTTVFVEARAPQIHEALRRVSRHTHNDLRADQQHDLQFLVRFLLDYPHQHDGTIVGLARKAIHWHQRRLAQERAAIVKRYGATTRVGTPPIPVPVNPGVRLLRTVDEIVREGQQMNHCVASDIPGAVSGHQYIFHIDHDGDAATVMVRRDGTIADSQGPRNRRNAASRWGERRLKAWVGQLRAAD